MDGIKILVVEDESTLGNLVKNYLEAQGYKVSWVKDGISAIHRFQEINPDLIILDLMLPGRSGFEVCKGLRKDSNVPIIMLTAKADEIDRILGLELGADDYVTKPFSLRELAARVGAVLRRAGKETKDRRNVLRIGDIIIDVEGHQVTVEGKKVALTPTEFSILLFLAEKPGRVAGRLQLVAASLGDAYIGYERSIDTHISNLRKKIEKDPKNPTRIQTVYGIGYKLVP
ncbi:MAG: response regulator transcription factor [Firmicutes bacterium]|jgi:DNA-binding response OmpR family regulator|nr:response regulator transcription factor [Bacillota bacterium]